MVDANELGTEFKTSYFERGYTEPFSLATDRSWDAVRQHFDDLLKTPGPWERADVPVSMIDNHPHGTNQLDRHLDCSLTHDILCDSAITRRLSSLYGKDMLLMFSEFMIKQPENPSGYIPWHQDGGYFGLHPSVSPSVWIAVTEATEENGALEFYPKCASERVPHDKSDSDDQWFEYEIGPEDRENFGNIRTETVEMEPGEAIIFHNSAIHRSTANESESPRIALQTRSTVPYARINSQKRPSQPMTVHTGNNQCGVHESTPIPEECKHVSR